MSSEWMTVTVGDICEVYDGPHATPERTDAGPIFLGISSLNSGRIDIERSDHISEEDFAQWTRRVVPVEGDIVFSYETRLGEAGLIPEGLRCCLGRRMGLLRIKDKNEVEPRFLLYNYLGPAYQAVIAERTVFGSTVERIPLKDVPGFPMWLPPLPEQKAISHILGTLDNKIELNRKTNKTLEAMAKALFKSWFVDFDPVKAKAEGRPTGLPDQISDLFPDSFEDSELGEIPSGWKCCSFTNLVEIISGGTPKTSINEYWDGSIPWFSVVDSPSSSDCWVIHTEKNITPEGLDNCSSKLLPVGTTIISARGTVGKVCLVGENMAMNQSCYGLKSKAENGDSFCFFLTKSLVEILEARAHGSVFSTITRDTLDGVVTISPPMEVVRVFDSIAKALLRKIRNNLFESQNLGSQRDALLPKLISGEIRIPDAERMLEEVSI